MTLSIIIITRIMYELMTQSCKYRLINKKGNIENIEKCSEWINFTNVTFKNKQVNKQNK